MPIFLYNLGIWLYNIAIRAAASFHPKAKLFVEGRKEWPMHLRTKVTALKKGRRIWFHCASLGEFEQGRPVIEFLKKEHPEVSILLTFFSPSGYEIRKNYPTADLVAYLPVDTEANARTFIEILQPELAVFVKYEFWYHYLHVLSEKKIPTLLIAAIFRNNQPFFKPYGILHRKMLTVFKQIFVQDEASRILLQTLHMPSVVCGDPRVDRVCSIAQETRDYPAITTFKGDNTFLITAGSTWPGDEQLLYEAFKSLPENVRLLIAPHEIDDRHVQQIMHTFREYSPCVWTGSEAELKNARVCIVNSIGHLAFLYRYADFAYIGGGFNKSGIHNTLEAAVYAIPMAYGPNYRKFTEAVYFTDHRAAESCATASALSTWVHALMHHGPLYQKACNAAGNYIRQNSGATPVIAAYISTHLPLP